MARRNNNKMTKLQPAVMTLTLATPSVIGGQTGRSTIDLSQICSLVNRRFYRQGISWAVAGFKVSSLKSGSVSIGKLPSTWVMSNSWEKSFRTWSKMNREALAESESVRPKFLDFKVYADPEHHQAGAGANLLPVSFAGVAVTPGEWDMSKIVVPFGPALPGNTTDFELIATGPNFSGPSPATGIDAVSLIEGYAASRGLPEIADPNTPDDASDASGSTAENWMAAMFNDGTDQTSEVLADMITENNIAPYPFENDGVNLDTMYPGGANQLSGLEWHDFINITETNVTNGIAIRRLKGGMFPCGLIAVNWTPNESANLVIQIDLVPGSHRGYMCQPMTEM